jgi:hypothetical protein
MGAGLLRIKGMQSNQLFRIEFDMLLIMHPALLF